MPSTTNPSIPIVAEEPSAREERERELPNHALPDYQMQLMLLEQQNKKRRMMMARQEEDEIQLEPEQGPVEVPIPKVGTAWPDESSINPMKRAYESMTAIDSPNGVVSAGSAANHGDNSKTAKRPRAETQPRAGPVSSQSPAHFASGHSTAEVEEDTPATMPMESDNTNSRPSRSQRPSKPGLQHHLRPAPSQQAPSQQYRSLHQIICSGSFHNGKSKIFTTAPTWACQRGKHDEHMGHLDAPSPRAVKNIPLFISESGDISFLVFHYYRCRDAVNVDHIHMRQIHTGVTDIWHETAILLVSHSLQTIMNRVSRCKSDRRAYWSTKQQDFARDEQNHDRTEEYSMLFLYHHRNALEAARTNAEASHLKEQISQLLGYVNMKEGSHFDQVDAVSRQGLVKSRDVEYLFCPNDVVISKVNGCLSAYVLRAWPSKGSLITLDCWSWAFDGNCYKRKPVVLAVHRPMIDVVRIRDLAVFPVAHATTAELNYLHARGEKSWSLRYQSFVAYEGWDFNAEHYYSNETRWMVDYKTYRQMHPRAEVFVFDNKQIVPFDSWPSELPHGIVPLKNILLIMPPQIHGFSFKKKNWCTLLVDNIRPVRWNKEAFGHLVLPSKTKDMVESLVMVRASTRDPEQRRLLAMRRDDLIAGKGNGLIMLLHGGPGTGKTLTAESVAELAEMPLYNVTCGDIGTKPEVVEKYLETVLMLGKRWNCVLLLDEADVFLEERSLADLERNSLVSVFLRTLEYYDGILILTSNRVGTFDAAFTSRIQVSLHYDALSEASRRRIWQNFLDLARADGEDSEIDSLVRRLDQLAAHEMNGRQIRNTFSTARQLAVFKKKPLCWDHVEQALSSVADFHSYLRKLHGHSEEQWARDNALYQGK